MPDPNLLLYMNLTGEVFYIVSHRMKSQNVREELQTRVYNDLALAICHPDVIKDILMGVLRITNLRFVDVKVIMDRIVHSSIMTVNSFSMEKLFELTLIATKFQYSVCQHPKDILLIALNHLDSIRDTLTDVIAIQLTENLHHSLVEYYGNMNTWAMQDCRYSILTYLTDVRLKMTNLIKLGYQTPDGDFVKNLPDRELHPDFSKPGVIEIFQYPMKPKESVFSEESTDIQTPGDCHHRTFPHHEPEERLPSDTETETDQDMKSLHLQPAVEEPNKSEISTHIKKFSTDCVQKTIRQTEVLELNSSRGISLGLSIYDIPGNSDEGEFSPDGEPIPLQGQVPSSTFKNLGAGMGDKLPKFSDQVDMKALQGLDLCSILLGCNISESNKSGSKSMKKVTLPTFNSGFEATACQSEEPVASQSGFASSGGINVVRIDARNDRSISNLALAAIAKQLDMEAEADMNARLHQELQDIIQIPLSEDND